MKKDFYKRALQREVWDPDSAALYLLGIDPNSARGKELTRHLEWPDLGLSKIPGGYDKFQHAKQAILEAIRAKEIPSFPSQNLGDLPVARPVDVISWAKKKGFDIPKQLDLVTTVASRTWPWGSHDTKRLQDLAAAAEKFWQSYNPKQPDAAPKNKVVEQWLVKERSVPARVAEVMAQMLRSDGIPAGPRRKAEK